MGERAFRLRERVAKRTDWEFYAIFYFCDELRFKHAPKMQAGHPRQEVGYGCGFGIPVEARYLIEKIAVGDGHKLG